MWVALMDSRYVVLMLMHEMFPVSVVHEDKVVVLESTCAACIKQDYWVYMFILAEHSGKES